MSNSFSPTYTLNLGDIDLSSLGYSLSAINAFEVASVDFAIGPLYQIEVAEITLAFGPTNYIDALDFILGGAQVLAMAGEIIHKSETSEIQVSNLIITDKNGTGPAIISAPSGTAYQFRGNRVAIENNTSSFTVTQEKSGYVWTNSGASVAISGILPSGALEGTTALFVRTGSDLWANPGSYGRILSATSGDFRPFGQAVKLASSGCRLGLISDGNNGWIPLIEQGTIE